MNVIEKLKLKFSELALTDELKDWLMEYSLNYIDLEKSTDTRVKLKSLLKPIDDEYLFFEVESGVLALFLNSINHLFGISCGEDPTFGKVDFKKVSIDDDLPDKISVIYLSEMIIFYEIWSESNDNVGGEYSKIYRFLD